MPEITKYYVVGSFNDWSKLDNYELIQDSQDTNKYVLENIDLIADDALKVRNGTWYSNESTWEDCGFYIDLSGNVCVSQSGTYNIIFYLTASNNNHIVLEKVEEPVATTVVAGSFHNINVTNYGDYYTINIGGVSFDIEKDTAEEEVE